MNTNTSAVIGLGALGTLIAYFGYQYLDDDNEKSETNTDEQTISDVSNNVEVVEDTLEKSQDNTNTTQDLSSNNVSEEISKSNIKLEVAEQLNKKALESKESNKDENKKEQSKWTNYWEDQYKNIDKEKQITVE